MGEGQPQGAWPQRRGGGGRLLDVEEGRAGVVGEGRGGVEGEACGGCCVVKSPCLLPPGPLIRLGGLLFSAPWTCPSHHPSCPLTLPPPPSSQVEKPKQKEKWRFLQKYWHKGAFFQVGLVAVIGEQAGRGVASSSMQHALFRTWGRFNRVSALPRARTHHPLASPHMGDADDERAQTDQLAASCRTSPNHAPHSPHPHPHPDLTSDLTWHTWAQEDADDERGTTAKDAIFDRDYSAPTGEDKFNKEILPKVMQVRAGPPGASAALRTACTISLFCRCVRGLWGRAGRTMSTGQEREAVREAVSRD